MRIKKIELTGFKSFKEKTSIFFSDGITGIVGPNGCGKSNIVDALLWVMGDMSSKHLRGSSMSDVIFSGTEDVSPVSLAEVSLVLENTGGLFPPKYFHHSEIMVTRRLYRSSESEYLINKEFVRLKDIQELFIDTGVGAKGFSIIEQESIGKIVTSKSEERKFLIEEVAGITRFQMRKKESQRKLQVTEQNILRLEDILSEKKRQIQRLERQVKKAERYKKLKEEIKKRDLFLAYGQSIYFSKLIKEREEKVKVLKDREELFQTDILKLEAEKEVLSLKLSKKESEIKESQEEQKKYYSLIREKEYQIKDLNLEIQKQIHKKDLNLSLNIKLKDRFKVYTQDLEKEKKELHSLLRDSKNFESLYQKQMNSFQTLQENLAERESLLSDRRSEHNEFSKKIFGLSSKIQSLKDQIREEETRKAGVREELDRFKEKEKKLDEKLKDFSKSLEKQKDLKEGIFKNIEEEIKKCDQFKKSEKFIQEGLNQLNNDFTKTSERLKTLKDFQESYEGFQDGTRFLLKEQAKGNRKGFSLLARLIEVPSKYEVAVEAALGKSLEILFVHENFKNFKEQAEKVTTKGSEGSQRGGKDGNSINQKPLELEKSDGEKIQGFVKNVLEELKEKKKGRSSFFYSPALKRVKNEDHLKRDGKVFLSDVVRVSQKLAPYERDFILNLLSQVIVASSLSEAFSFKKQFLDHWVVTLEGDFFTPQGVVVGGSFHGLDRGLLNQKNQIFKLEIEKKKILDQVLKQEELLGEAVKNLERSKLEIENLQKIQDQKKVSILELIRDEKILENEKRSLLQSFKRQESEVSYHEERVSVLERSCKKLKQELKLLQDSRDSLGDEIEVLASELEALREEVESYRKKVTQTQIEWAQKDQEKEEFSNRVKKIETYLVDLKAERKRVQKEDVQIEEFLSFRKKEIEEKKVELEKTLFSSKKNEENLFHLQDEFDQCSKSLKELQEKLSKSYQKVHQCKTETSDLSLKLEELKLNLKHLKGQIFEQYNHNLENFSHEPKPAFFKDFEQQDTKEIEEGLRDLRQKLKSIGEVYLLAIEEHEELKTSLDFLSMQFDELVNAKKELIQVINKVDQICSIRFKESFEEVNLKFSKVFPILFGGGKARLSLVQAENGDVVGIEIDAEPPGKKLKNIKLLSGGEKALTALALIFSIFILKPSPFCILDEVDAPLDDVNVFRFNALLSEMVRYSQVILVTHNKYSMKMSDFLFGVTMERKGISKIVSVQLNEGKKLSSDKERSFEKIVSKEF